MRPAGPPGAAALDRGGSGGPRGASRGPTPGIPWFASGIRVEPCHPPQIQGGENKFKLFEHQGGGGKQIGGGGGKHLPQGGSAGYMSQCYAWDTEKQKTNLHSNCQNFYKNPNRTLNHYGLPRYVTLKAIAKV